MVEIHVQFPKGKTTAMADISERLRSRGFGVYVVPEAATIIFTGGATIGGHSAEQSRVLQASLLQIQIALEDSFYQIARASSKPFVLLCDRGTMDGRAYMSPQDWTLMLGQHNWNPVSIRDERYDLVIHMVTAANGALPFYQLSNNVARSETPTEACALDQKTQQAWVGHPHLHIIDNRVGFREKINRVFAIVGELVGVHTSTQAVRKFLVAKDVRPRALDYCVANLEEFEVEQTFLKRVLRDGLQESVRRRGGAGAHSFVHKVRRPLADGRFHETKRRITNLEYISLLSNADPERRTVRIKRQCFLYKSQYYVLDTILNVDPTVRLIRTQVEENRSDLELPTWITIEKEVTGQFEWSLFAISTRIARSRMKWPMTEIDRPCVVKSDAIDIASSF